MNEVDKNKPHGLGVGFQVEVFDNVNGELVPVQSHKEEESKLEAYINIKNEKTGKEVELPMRSFVQKFLTILYTYFTGSDNATDAYTRTRSVSYGAITSLGASGASKKGLLVGAGITPVTLSDAGIETNLIKPASFAYSNTTLVAPYLDSLTKIMKFELRRMLTSTYATTIYITELLTKTRVAFASETASGGASAVNTLGKTVAISRDLLSDGRAVSLSSEAADPNGIPLSADEGVTFQFKFKIGQVTTGAYQGGAVFNFVKMIYNQLFKGNPNGSQLINTSGANLDMDYTLGRIVKSGSLATTGTTVINPFHVGEHSAGTDYGILVGVYDSRELENPVINCDDYAFVVKTTGLTIGATEIAAITNPSLANTAQFIVSRTFTNSGTVAIKLNRAGLKIRKGAFIAINTLAEPVDSRTDPTFLVLQPNQVLKISYPFQIQA